MTADRVSQQLMQEMVRLQERITSQAEEMQRARERSDQIMAKLTDVLGRIHFIVESRTPLLEQAAAGVAAVPAMVRELAAAGEESAADLSKAAVAAINAASGAAIARIDQSAAAQALAHQEAVKHIAAIVRGMRRSLMFWLGLSTFLGTALGGGAHEMVGWIMKLHP